MSNNSLLDLSYPDKREGGTEGSPMTSCDGQIAETIYAKTAGKASGEHSGLC